VILSIIIPVYNVGGYLKQCVESALSQNIPDSDYEIILVNDGSTDGSLIIAEEFSRKYNHISLYSQRNMGLSAARNTGLNYAKGDYVWFVDSDDFIEKNCLKDIVDQLNNNQLEGLRLRPVRYCNGICDYDNRLILNGIVTGLMCLEKRKSYREAVWLTIYKRRFLEKYGLRFMVGKIHEDNEFTPKAYYYMKRLKFLDKHYYYYRFNSSSLTKDNTLLKKRCLDLIDIASAMQRFCEEVVAKEYKSIYYSYIAFVLNTAMEYASDLDLEVKGEVENILERCPKLFNSYKESSELLLRIEGFLLNTIPAPKIKIYNILNYVRKVIR
jgi:glycosyltransferase involved in cell wall biosynthesis